MQYPGTQPSGYSLGGAVGDDPNSLESRKKQLLQKLLGQQNQSGLQGTHAMPLYGGGGRSASELQQGGLPSLTFNPFLAMAAGRPNENFQAPNGITQAALAQAQAGFAPNLGGGAPGDPNAPQNLGGNAQQAAQVFTGASQDSAGGIAGSPAAAAPAGTAPPDQAWAAPQGTSVRHLAGGGDPRALQPFYGTLARGIYAQ